MYVEGFVYDRVLIAVLIVIFIVAIICILNKNYIWCSSANRVYVACVDRILEKQVQLIWH